MPQAIPAFIAAVAATATTAASAIGGAVSAAAGIFSGMGALASTVIGVGINFGVSALLGMLDSPKTIKPSDVQNVIRQSVPSRRRHYGLRKTGGFMSFVETKNGNLYMIVYLGEGILDSIDEIIIDNRPVTLDGDGWATSSPYPAGCLKVETRAGTGTDTAYELVVDTFPTIWSTAHRLRGAATLMIRAGGVSSSDFNRIYPNRIPVANLVGYWSRCFDPRDAGQSPADPSTWTMTPNLALQLADYLTHADGLQIDRDEIDTDFLIAAADIADEELTTRNGAIIGRYHGALTYEFSAEPKDILSRFLNAMMGRICYTAAGKIGISAGRFREPTVRIPDRHILSYELRDTSGPLKVSNEIVVKYTNTEASHTEGTARHWRDEARISETGQVLTRTIDAYEAQTHNHARRIAKWFDGLLNPRWQGTIQTNLAGLEAWDEEGVTFEILDLDIDGPFRINGFDVDWQNLTITFDVIFFDGSALAFDALTEEGEAPVIPETLEEDTVPTPQNLTVLAGQRTISGGNRIAVITARWDAPGRSGLSVEAQIKRSDDTVWSSMTVATDNTAEATGLEDGADYDVRVRFLAPLGTASLVWALVDDVTAIADPVAPGVPTNLSVIAISAPDAALIAWRMPNSDNARMAFVYRSASSLIGPEVRIATIYSSPSADQEAASDTLPAGTWHFFVSAANGSGVESARVHAGSLTI
ncbi:hypothetical protein ACRC7T_18775 [Segnochrobactraceae bacterium EtOH-i3]